MAIPGSQGGDVFTGAALADAVAVTRWTGNWQGRLAEVTTTGTGNGTAYAGVRVDPQWEAIFPLDDPAFPETLGFVPGTILPTLIFKHGSSLKADQLVNTTVETVQKTCSAPDDVPRVVVTGRGGILTTNVAAPVT